MELEGDPIVRSIRLRRYGKEHAVAAAGSAGGVYAICGALPRRIPPVVWGNGRGTGAEVGLGDAWNF